MQKQSQKQPEPTQTEMYTLKRNLLNTPGMDNKKVIKAHAAMFMACAIWGLMAPLGSDAMHHGISGISMVTMRVSGAAVCFWLTSFFTKKEKVARKDMLKLFFAGMLSIVFNQCCYTIGLSITSPVNASIVTTTMPIITMVLAAIFLGEPITGKKVTGIALGVSGALIIISGSVAAGTSKDGKLVGDLLCLTAQTCFAIYLTIFKNLIKRYSVVTCMKWMFTFATAVIVPFTWNEVSNLPVETIEWKTWCEAGFVVFAATYIAYIFMTSGQKILCPTVVSVYNYVQPTVACMVSVAAGIGSFGWSKAAAVVLVFSGVWLVTQSKSRADMEKEKRLNEK